MRRKFALVVTIFLSALGTQAQAQSFAECQFGFDIDTQSSAFQAMVVDGEQKRGFWLGIDRAPPALRKIATYVGRLQVCLITPDGKPRSITRGGQTATLSSPFIANCTATLLPDNRLLTNNHCYYDPDLVRAGFTIVQEARINFNYTSKDDVGAVRTYRVAQREIAAEADLDALLLQVIGDANGDLGGHVPMQMNTQVEPFQELRMVHHPAAEPQQYSTGTCQVHRRNDEIGAERSPFRHTCESTGGSSGSLLFDARSLAVVALHNQGGLSRDGGSFNGAHKIEMINAAFDLGFEEKSPDPVAAAPARLDPAIVAVQALAEALALQNKDQQAKALRQLIAEFPTSPSARTAETILAALSPAPVPAPAPAPVLAPVIAAPAPKPVQKPSPPVASTDLSLAAQMEADVDVQSCDDAAGHPYHPDRVSGLMIQAGTDFDDIDVDFAVIVCEAALTGFPDHPRLLAFLGRAFDKRGDYINAAKNYEKAALLEDVIGQQNLGYLYLDGSGVGQSDESAAVWFNAAAEQGLSSAQYQLAILYEKGRGAPKSMETAVEWYRASAGQGYVFAEYYLGFLYEKGNGVPQSFAQAANLYRKAGEQDHARSQARLAFLYDRGEGVEKSKEQFVFWITKAAELGHAQSQYNLASSYYDGYGLPKSLGTAAVWYNRAIEQKHAGAMNNLAGMFEFGTGVLRDPERAAELYIMAIKAGHESVHHRAALF